MNEADTITDETDADFEAGFAHPETQPTETPDGQGEQAQETKTETAAETVEYVQLTKAEADELRARAALAVELKATADKSFGTAFGKIGGIERQIKALTEGAAVDIDQSDIDALRNDGFEPLAKALEKVKSLRTIPVGSDAEAIERAVQERVTPAVQRLEVRMLSREHPDWKEIDADPAFAAFNQSQGEEYLQRLAKASREYDSEVVSDAIAKFKAHRKAEADKAKAAAPAPAPSRTTRMAAAQMPRASGAPAAPSPTDDFLAGFQQG